MPETHPEKDVGRPASNLPPLSLHIPEPRYRPGDTPRQIAWKASARADRLLVREYEASTNREVELDWFALATLPHEARIRRLTRWVLEADRQAVRYRMRLPAMTIGPGRGSEHRHACLRALALLPDA